MQKDTIIYVTDQRQKYLADMLGGEQTDCRNSGGIDYERVGNIVFPTPFSKLKLINSDIEKLKHNIIINNIAVWGGMMPECFPGIDRGCDFMRDETVIEQNAIVTAEATASIAIQKSIHGIYGSKVLVSGFGKCGKAIARVFSAIDRKSTRLHSSHDQISYAVFCLWILMILPRPVLKHCSS